QVSQVLSKADNGFSTKRNYLWSVENAVLCFVCSDSFNQCPFDNHQTVESASQCFCEAISWSVSPKTVSQWVPNHLTSDLASQPPEGSVSWYVLH
ncbi:unnamed protein product, partial [Porites lobata]